MFGRMPEKIRKRKYFRYSDAQYLREAAPSLEFVTSFENRPSFGERQAGTNEIRYESERVDRLILRGVEPEYSQAIPLCGRFSIHLLTSNGNETHSGQWVVSTPYTWH